jgi:hypothetical protein
MDPGGRPRSSMLGLHFMLCCKGMNVEHVKRMSAIGIPLVALGLLATGCCCDKAGSAQSGNSEKGATQLTGSYLKQDITRNGEITNGKDNVRVLDREKIDRSGAADVNEFLRLQGVR